MNWGVSGGEIVTIFGFLCLQALYGEVSSMLGKEVLRSYRGILIEPAMSCIEERIGAGGTARGYALIVYYSCDLWYSPRT